MFNHTTTAAQKKKHPPQKTPPPRWKKIVRPITPWHFFYLHYFYIRMKQSSPLQQSSSCPTITESHKSTPDKYQTKPSPSPPRPGLRSRAPYDNPHNLRKRRQRKWEEQNWKPQRIFFCFRSAEGGGIVFDRLHLQSIIRFNYLLAALNDNFCYRCNKNEGASTVEPWWH